MTRVLEFIVALIFVFIIAVIYGLFLPANSHIQRSLHISHNPRQIYDVLNNFRRFEDYAAGELRANDPNVKFTLSGPAYGPGATISWNGNAAVGNGKLVNKGGNIKVTNKSHVVWDLTNDWHGQDKTYTIQVKPGQDQRVSTVAWSYDVQCGWNLVCRYAQLWIHGQPATTIKMGLGGLQTMLAGIPNVDYSNLNPGLYHVPATPVLLVKTKAPRTLDDIDAAKKAAVKELHEAMDKLDVKAAGPITVITINYGSTKYTFDVAIPINTTTITVDGKSHDLTALPPPPTSFGAASTAAESSSAASASSVASAASAAPAASAGKPASASSTAGSNNGKGDNGKSNKANGNKANGNNGNAGPVPGELDKKNRLIVNANVRALMMPAGKVLEATWTGEAGVPLVRLALQAFADTHGYQFNTTIHRIYDKLASLPTVADQDQIYRVFLPVQKAPAQTPGQISGDTHPLAPLNPSLWGAAAPKSSASGNKKH